MSILFSGLIGLLMAIFNFVLTIAYGAGIFAGMFWLEYAEVFYAEYWPDNWPGFVYLFTLAGLLYALLASCAIAGEHPRYWRRIMQAGVFCLLLALVAGVQALNYLLGAVYFLSIGVLLLQSLPSMNALDFSRPSLPVRLGYSALLALHTPPILLAVLFTFLLPDYSPFHAGMDHRLFMHVLHGCMLLVFVVVFILHQHNSDLHKT